MSKKKMDAMDSMEEGSKMISSRNGWDEFYGMLWYLCREEKFIQK